jgi:hypothetical protein
VAQEFGAHGRAWEKRILEGHIGASRGWVSTPCPGWVSMPT